jgi:hypothetical protein
MAYAKITHNWPTFVQYLKKLKFKIKNQKSINNYLNYYHLDTVLFLNNNRSVLIYCPVSHKNIGTGSSINFIATNLSSCNTCYCIPELGTYRKVETELCFSIVGVKVVANAGCPKPHISVHSINSIRESSSDIFFSRQRNISRKKFIFH